MSGFLIVALAIAMAAVLGSLMIGLIQMTRPASAEQSLKSNKWMRIRVILQGVALAIFALAVMAGGK